MFRITDLTVKCYFWLPNSIQNQVQNWSLSNAKNRLSKRLGGFTGGNLLKGVNIIKGYPFYYYQAAPSNWAELVFESKSDMQEYIRGSKTEVQKYIGRQVEYDETDVDPVLRFLIEKKIRNCSMIDVNISDDDVGQSIYDVTMKDINPSTAPTIYPSPLVAAIDGEMYSPEITNFPDMLRLDCPIRMFSYVTQELGKPETRKNYCIVIGDCIPVKDTIVYVVRTEKELIEKLCNLIIETDPTILTGYNIHAFDFEYLNTRLAIYAGRLKCLDRCAANTFSDFTHIAGPRGAKYTTIDMKGRLIFDMILFYRDFLPDRLKSYKLDSVCEHYGLETKKQDMPYRDLNMIFRDSDCHDPTAASRMVKAVEYCVQDAYLCILLMEKKNVFGSCCGFSTVVGLNPDQIITKGQIAKGDAFLLRYARWYSEVGRIILTRRTNTEIKYDGGYVRCYKPGFHKNVACADVQSMYPSLMKGLNLCPTTLRDVNDDEDSTDNIVEVRYRTIERTTKFQIEADTMIEDTYSDHSDSDDEVAEAEIPKKKSSKLNDIIEITKDVVQTFRFVSDSVRVGLIPMAIKELLSERKKRRDEMKTTTSAEKIADLDAEQNALKIMANSLYGAMGNQFPRCRSCVEVASSVTTMGQNAIKSVNRYFKNLGNVVIYNDTDSVMFRSDAICKELYRGREATDYDRLRDEHYKIIRKMNPGAPDEGVMPKSLVMECEKFIIAGIYLKPKMYILWTYDGRTPDGKLKVKMVPKGVPLARRDCCGALLVVYEALIISIYEEVGYVDSLQIVLSFLEGFESLDFSQFVTVSRYRGSYKSANAPMAVLANKMISFGLPVAAGDRLSYVIYTTDEWEENPRTKPSPSMRYATKEMLPSIEGARIDYVYYFTNRIASRLHGVFSVCFPELKDVECTKDPDDGTIGDCIERCRTLVNKERSFDEAITYLSRAIRKLKKITKGLERTPTESIRDLYMSKR